MSDGLTPSQRDYRRNREKRRRFYRERYQRKKEECRARARAYYWRVVRPRMYCCATLAEAEQRVLPMKCLSVQQPWADLLVRGVKDVENRGWATAYRGPLLIHAGRKFDREGYAALARGEWAGALGPPESYVRGAIVGQVELVDVRREPFSDWHVAGRYGWYLRAPVAFAHPVPYPGRLKLFDVPPGIVAAELEDLRK